MCATSLVALLIAACGASIVPPTPPVTPRASPLQTAQRPPATAPPAGVSGGASPSPSHAPTFSPTDLTFDRLAATHDACWRDNYRDVAGHRISGTQLHFVVGVTNTSGIASRTLWVKITTTGVFTAAPSLLTANWADSIPTWGDNTTITIPLATVRPDKSAKFKFDVLFETVFDVHYNFEIALGPIAFPGIEPTLTYIAGQAYTDWASVRVCL